MMGKGMGFTLFGVDLVSYKPKVDMIGENPIFPMGLSVGLGIPVQRTPGQWLVRLLPPFESGR
jgi:hypothetical protein